MYEELSIRAVNRRLEALVLICIAFAVLVLGTVLLPVAVHAEEQAGAQEIGFGLVVVTEENFALTQPDDDIVVIDDIIGVDVIVVIDDHIGLIEVPERLADLSIDGDDTTYLPIVKERGCGQFGPFERRYYAARSDDGGRTWTVVKGDPCETTWFQRTVVY